MLSGTIELEGRRRHGKTQLGVVLALELKFETGFPLYTNVPELIDLGLAVRETEETFFSDQPGIHFLDEFWRELDSWGFKDNYERKKIQVVTQFWQLQGHNDQIFIYSTQLHSQMTNRIRDSNDYTIHCEKKRMERGFKFIYTVIDGYSGNTLRRFTKTTEQMKFIYNLYNTKGKILPVFN